MLHVWSMPIWMQPSRQDGRSFPPMTSCFAVFLNSYFTDEYLFLPFFHKDAFLHEYVFTIRCNNIIHCSRRMGSLKKYERAKK